MIYKHVAVIGIDGMGKFNSQTDTPNLDRIFNGGAVAWSAVSQNPTISAQNWGAMLLGAAPLIHKLTNSSISNTPYTNDALPSLFRRIRESDPDCYLASVCNWNPINHGIVENGLGVEKLTADNDALLTPMILECVAKKPKFLFVQLDDVDGAGHSGGYGSEKHYEEIRRADGYTGQIYSAYEKAGILEDTLFIVLADHGGVRNGHGGYTDTEKYVFMGIAGKDVNESFIEYAETRDIAAIVLHALGLSVPEYDENGFTSQIPEGIWENTKKYYRKPAQKTIIHQRATPGNLSDFIETDNAKLIMHLDNSLCDSTDKCRLSEKGTVKFYSDGVNGSCGEFGKTGFAVTEDVKFGDESFSVAFWVETDPTINEAPALMSNQNWWWQNRKEKGVTVALRNNDVMFNVSNGNDHLDTVVPFPEGMEAGWMHYAVAFDREYNEMRFYNNFSLRLAIEIPEEYRISYDTALPFVIGNDGKGQYNNISHDFIFRLDDIIITSRAFNDESIEKLRKYYYGD